MLGMRKIGRMLVIWVMIPITLAIGQPRMECLRAKAEGKLFCDCRGQGVARQMPGQMAEACCASDAAESDCCMDFSPTEPAEDNLPGSRRCCAVSVSTLGVPPDSTIVSNTSNGSFCQLPDIICAWQGTVLPERVSWQIHAPPLDRVTVFCHLVI